MTIKNVVFDSNLTKEYSVGDVFLQCDELYILADTGNSYSLVCLNDGQSWNNESSLEEVVACIKNNEFKKVKSIEFKKVKSIEFKKVKSIEFKK